MILTELLSELKQKKIYLYLDKGSLRGKFPQNTVTPEIKAILQAHRDELIAYLQQTQLSQNTTLTAVHRGDKLPLSFSQERLWFLEEFDGGVAAYNMPGALRLVGELDIEILERSLNEVIRRHEVLRTTFRAVDGEPQQIIASSQILEIPVVDLRGFSAERRESEIRRYLEEDAQQPFDLVQGPLVRAALLFLKESSESATAEHILLFTLHHIVSDGWSTAILVQEFITLYEAYRAGRSSPLPELAIQYADYAIWQREWLQGERLEQQVNYWKQHLVGVPAVLELPTDYPRPVVQSYRGSTLCVTVSQSITEQLKQLGRQQDATLFMVLLAAFNILLSRYSGQDDLCVGTPIANRNRLEIEGLIGFFVNTLVLRTDLSGNPSFTELLKRIKEVCLGAQAHQDLPFEKLVEELSPVRDMSHHPLFQVMLALQNTPETALEIAGLRITPEVMEVGTSKFDLDLEITESEHGLEIQYSYNTDLFDQPTIARLAAHYGVLLAGIAASPDQFINELPLLTDEERAQLLTDWHGSEVGYPERRCIHEIFEEQAERNPAAVAVVFEGKQLTYAALNCKANQLAHCLRSQGVGPEVLVGICVERSLEMIVGILGILKAGGAYLPIEPSYPKERIAFMLGDADPLLILVHQATYDMLPDGIRRIDLKESEVAYDHLNLSNPAVDIHGKNLAYIIYTSGSTGKPKGVGVTHDGVIHSTYARFNYYQKSVGCFLLLSSMAFDSSVAGVFWTLSQGGRLCLVSEETLHDPALLVRQIAQEKVTHLLCLPSFYQLILEQQGHNLNSLRSVIVAGEPCAPGLAAKHYECLVGTALFNEYGPTENTVWSSVCLVKSSGNRQHTISIGRPINNVEIYLLDQFLNLVVPGAKGEIYIGGAGLARGYLNRTYQTADCFIPHPFKSDGCRLYRTGDLARFRPSRELEFLGRVDNQVKIRGFRIELSEIEACLTQISGIKEAVVLVKEYAATDHRLIAYCVPISINDLVHPDIESVKSQLKEFLPEYMVPFAFVFVDRMPLTPNGKVDRSALYATILDGLQEPQQQQAARNVTEEALVRIWSEVLRIDRIGVFDSFFALGGHSILSIQLVHKLNAQFNLSLPVNIIFKRPNIAQLAEIIDGKDMSFSEHIASQVDLLTEAQLELSIQPDIDSVSHFSSARAVFLTGATGFLGVFLLHELLQQTSADVYCLVRAKSSHVASEKLQNSLKRYGIFNTELMARVFPVCGDLAETRLGLTLEQFDYLVEHIDAVYHNGALVNFAQPYAVLKAANVAGTREVLRLACTGKTKPVHYISTLSVFGTQAPTHIGGFLEDEFPDFNVVETEGGYSQSKWVAEKMMRIAASRGLPITIHRPATVSGHSVTGVWNSDDFLCRLIRGCVDLGKAPVVQDHFDIVPVDYVSKAIVYLSRQPGAINKTFHFSNQYSIKSEDLIDWINALGYPVAQVPYDDWRTNVVAVVEQNSSHPLYPILPMLPAKITDDQLYAEMLKEYSTDFTEEALLQSGIQCPSANGALFGVYLSYLQRNGLIKQSYQHLSYKGWSV